MKTSIIIGISIVLILFVILCVRLYQFNKEKWYPTTTYVNTPTNFGIYPNNMMANPYYNAYDWARGGGANPRLQSRVRNWAGRPASQVGAPFFSRDNIMNRYPYPLADVPNSGAPIPIGNPVPLDTVRMMGPMLTSIKSPKDYAIGQWVYAGTAYTDNQNDDTYGTVYQLNLDPGRELFRYTIKIKGVGTIPLQLPPYHNRLEDGDRFKVQGMEGKGEFVFSEADKYRYVYT